MTTLRPFAVISDDKTKCTLTNSRGEENTFDVRMVGGVHCIVSNREKNQYVEFTPASKISGRGQPVVQKDLKGADVVVEIIGGAAVEVLVKIVTITGEVKYIEPEAPDPQTRIYCRTCDEAEIKVAPAAGAGAGSGTSTPQVNAVAAPGAGAGAAGAAGAGAAGAAKAASGGASASAASVSLAGARAGAGAAAAGGGASASATLVPLAGAVGGSSSALPELKGASSDAEIKEIFPIARFHGGKYIIMNAAGRRSNIETKLMNFDKEQQVEVNAKFRNDSFKVTIEGGAEGKPMLPVVQINKTGKTVIVDELGREEIVLVQRINDRDEITREGKFIIVDASRVSPSVSVGTGVAAPSPSLPSLASSTDLSSVGRASAGRAKSSLRTESSPGGSGSGVLSPSSVTGVDTSPFSPLSGARSPVRAGGPSPSTRGADDGMPTLHSLLRVDTREPRRRAGVEGGVLSPLGGVVSPSGDGFFAGATTGPLSFAAVGRGFTAVRRLGHVGHGELSSATAAPPGGALPPLAPSVGGALSIGKAPLPARVGVVPRSAGESAGSFTAALEDDKAFERGIG